MYTTIVSSGFWIDGFLTYKILTGVEAQLVKIVFSTWMQLTIDFVIQLIFEKIEFYKCFFFLFCSVLIFWGPSVQYYCLLSQRFTNSAYSFILAYPMVHRHECCFRLMHLLIIYIVKVVSIWGLNPLIVEYL